MAGRRACFGPLGRLEAARRESSADPKARRREPRRAAGGTEQGAEGRCRAAAPPRRAAQGEDPRADQSAGARCRAAARRCRAAPVPAEQGLGQRAHPGFPRPDNEPEEDVQPPAPGDEEKKSTRPAGRNPARDAWDHSDVLLNPLAAAPENIRLFAPSRKRSRTSARGSPCHPTTPDSTAAPASAATTTTTRSRSRAPPESTCNTKSNSGRPSPG